jgi:two-component system chemotaxis response regulator CheB
LQFNKGDAMSGHNIIVIGASQGGVEALKTLASGLPADLPAAVFVVLHTSPYHKSYLPEILSRVGPLRATHAFEGEEIQPGRIYIAPPDHHLMVNDGHARVTRGPKENFARPAVDPLFRSAANNHGPRVVGVVLTGELDDGTDGLVEVKAKGGIAVVEDPQTAFSPSMPRSALEYVKVDYCLPLAEIAPLLVRLALDPVEAATINSVSTQAKKIERAEVAMKGNSEEHERPAAFTCPECRCTLWEQENGGLLRFHCRVGHAFSPKSLLAGQSEALENALWAAISLMEERAAFTERLSAEARKHNQAELASAYKEEAHRAPQHTALIRQILLNQGKWALP